MLTRFLRRVRPDTRARAEEAPTVSSAAAEEAANYRNLLVNGAFFGVIDGGILNYLPVFLARLGASASLVGLLTSGPALAGILFYIPGGAYVERHRDLVSLVTRATLLTRLSYPLIALLPLLLGPQQIPLAAVALWTLSAIPTVVHVPAWMTVMQKAISPRRRAVLNGTRWALYSLVSAVCLAGFGYLLDQVRFPDGYQIVFLVSFVAALLNLYFFAKVRVSPFVPDRSEVQAGAGLAERLRAFFRPLTECREFVRFNLGTLPYRLALSIPIALFSIFWVRDLQASDGWIGLRGTAGYAALVVGYRLWGRVANRIGHRTLLVVCGIALSLYPMLTALAPSVEWLLPAAVLWGLALPGVDIALFDLLLAACPEGRQPSFSATANMLVSLVAFLGPLLGAGVAQAVGVRTALLIGGGLQLAAVVFFRLLPSREQEGLGAAT